MALRPPASKLEREKRVQDVITFASSLTSRFDKPREPALSTDLQAQIRHLPLQASPAVTTSRIELDKLGTELWNLSTRLRRRDAAHSGGDNKSKGNGVESTGTVCLLRAFAFLLLDSAGTQTVKVRERKPCIRLMRVALKAAKACIIGNDMDSATKVLERAAIYEDVLTGDDRHSDNDDATIAKCLRLEYFAVRVVLAFRQDRLDMAEHMFAKFGQVDMTPTPNKAEDIADLFYEIGKQALSKRNYEAAVKWLERSHNVIEVQDFGLLSSEAGELKLCIMQGLVQSYIALKTIEATDKAWHLIKLMETYYSDKMLVSLLKIELLSVAEHIDEAEYYDVLARMIRIIVLNDTNFKTLLHHIHKLKDLSNVYACKALDDLMKSRLVREDNSLWIEKAVVTRIWLSTSDVHVENPLEQLRKLLDSVLQESSFVLSAPATHAAQTLIWKKVEEKSAQENQDAAESWCQLCLHPLFDKAGAQNKVKITRKLIQTALLRQDYATARDVYRRAPEVSRDEPITRYLMYRVGLKSGDVVFAAECLDVVCQSSSKDATLLYACVMEAQRVGDKRQAIHALQRVLEKYDYTAPVGIHLPALLRVTLRLLRSEIMRDGAVDCEILSQMCQVFEGACSQAKDSQRRPVTPEQQLFTIHELKWFSKNSYNFSLKYCAEIAPHNLARLLTVCAEFITLLKKQEQEQAAGAADLNLRLAFCEYLAACTYTTLARAEDNQEAYLQHYLEVCKHCQAFRRTIQEGANELSGAAQDDILSKKFQVVKLEIEACVKLQRWDDLEELFEQCWSCKSSDRYETLADLVLVIHSSLVKANVHASSQSKVLSTLQKIINLTSRQHGNDVTRLSRWLRCLFNLTLSLDENISLKCLDQAIQIAAKKQGHACHPSILLSFIATPPPSSPEMLADNAELADEELKQSDCYPAAELEWMATSAFNRAIDYYVGDNDAKCKTWAERAMTAAQWLEDDGQLRDLLMGKFSALQFSK